MLKVGVRVGVRDCKSTKLVGREDGDGGRGSERRAKEEREVREGEEEREECIVTSASGRVTRVSGGAYPRSACVCVSEAPWRGRWSFCSSVSRRGGG